MIINLIKNLLLVFSFFLLSCNQRKIYHIESNNWAPDVKQGINDFMDKYAHTNNAYVVFDFDNTTCIYDISIQMQYYQIETMSFAMNPAQMDSLFKKELYDKPIQKELLKDVTNEYAILYEKYGPFTPEGLSEEKQASIKQDKVWQDFSTKTAMIYDITEDFEFSLSTYDFLVYYVCGMSQQEVYKLSKRSHAKYSQIETTLETWKSPDGIKSFFGMQSHEWTSGIQVTEDIKELWRTLTMNGIDVWVCSASGMQQVLAAVDHFGLHPYCKGVIAMTIKEHDGKLIPEYDYETGYGFLTNEDGTWTQDTIPLAAQPSREGKVETIENVLLPRYNGVAPIAGFGDSSGDFNFCTEFSNLKMVICFNRANRKVTDGGSLLAEMAIYQRDVLDYTLPLANKAGETMYFLQGRNENGKRTLIPTNSTIRLNTKEERLFDSEQNEKLLKYAESKKMTTADMANTFSIQTSVEKSSLGFEYGWLSTYNGYHSK